MKKVLNPFLAGMLAVTLLAGCSSSSTAASSSTQTATTEASTVPTEVTITDHGEKSIS